jgi:AraC-like DNA-binding protein
MKIDADLYRRLTRAREFMDDCYAAPLTLEDISREACISPYHFLRLFREAFKKTPHQYLTERRISAAKEMLQTKPITVTDVCFEVGYESLGSFVTLFHRHVGYTPRTYRRVFLINQPLAGIPTCFIRMFAGDPSRLLRQP